MADIKQIIVMRVRYPDGKGGTRKLRTGKLCAQAAHSSMKVLVQHSVIVKRSNQGRDEDRLEVGVTPDMKAWLDGVFTKIVCYVETEDELRALYQKAQEANIPCSLIEDSGATEFGGVKTVTCIAIGPAKSEDLAPITGSLPLL